MGCCFSKSEKRKNRAAAGCGRRCEPEDRSPPSPEVETVKEVLSETPTPVVNAAVPMEREVEKATKEDVISVDAAASDLGSCVSLSLATDEVSEAASESSSVATSSVAGPDRSPGKLAARRRPTSAGLGPARRDRAVGAVSYGVRSRSARGSPSPPPRHVTRDRSARRRSPSPAAKRPSSEQHRAASPAASVQRKPPVPVMRPSGRVSPQRSQAMAPPPPPPPRVVLPPSPSQPENDAATVSSEVSVPDASACGDDVQGDRAVDGKESLENPLMSLECFIFL